MDMNQMKLNKKIEDIATEAARRYIGGSGFIDQKIGDTPTDALSLVNRKYVTNNGTTRPTSSVIGQPFIDMNLASGRGKPIWWNGTGWIDATGTYV